MKESNYKVGDLVGMVCGQGPELGYLILTEIRDTDATAWEVGYDIKVNVQLDRIWPASDAEKAVTWGFSKHPGKLFTVEQLADKARAKLGLPAPDSENPTPPPALHGGWQPIETAPSAPKHIFSHMEGGRPKLVNLWRLSTN